MEKIFGLVGFLRYVVFKDLRELYNVEKLSTSNFFCMGSNFVGSFLPRITGIIEVIARHEAIVGREIVEETIIIGALSVLEALKLNLSRL